MIVPFGKVPEAPGRAGPPSGPPPPSEAAMLMAVAQLHQEGRFKTAMDTSGMRRSTNVEDDRQDQIREYKRKYGPDALLEQHPLRTDLDEEAAIINTGTGRKPK